MTFDLECELGPVDDIYILTLIVCYISANAVIEMDFKAKNRIFDLIFVLFNKMTYDLEHDLWPVDDIYIEVLIVYNVSAHTVIQLD